MKEEGIYRKRLEGNGAKKQCKGRRYRQEQNKTSYDKLKADGARPKRDEGT